jgi:hypothetical protein
MTELAIGLLAVFLFIIVREFVLLVMGDTHK